MKRIILRIKLAFRVLTSKYAIAYTSGDGKVTRTKINVSDDDALTFVLTVADAINRECLATYGKTSQELIDKINEEKKAALKEHMESLKQAADEIVDRLGCMIKERIAKDAEAAEEDDTKTGAEDDGKEDDKE